MKLLRYAVFFMVFGLPKIHAAQMDMSALVQQAPFIFAGHVQKVEYALSQATEDAAAIPYTFVTYSIEHIFKGQYQNAWITLRFFGGPTGENGQLMISPNYPLFDVNDHDVLLVTGNTYYECPLVGCSMGRFRIIQNQVVNEYGQTLHFDEQGQLVTGQPIKDKNINEHQVGDKLNLTRKSQDDATLTEKPGRGFDENIGDDAYLDLDNNKSSNPTTDATEPTPTALNSEEFYTQLNQTLADVQTHVETPSDDNQVIVSADPGQPFYSQGANPQAAPTSDPTLSASIAPATIKQSTDISVQKIPDVDPKTQTITAHATLTPFPHSPAPSNRHAYLWGAFGLLLLLTGLCVFRTQYIKR